MAHYRSYSRKDNGNGCIYLIGFWLLVIFIMQIKERPEEVFIILIALYILYKVFNPIFKFLIFPFFSSIEQKYKNHQFKVKKCSHGISGGWNLNKCYKCVQIKSEEEIKRLESEEISRMKIAEIEKRNEIKLLTRKTEVELIRLINKKNTTKLDYLISINPFLFEKVIGDMYKQLGYKVEQTPKTNDKGKDLIMKKGGKRYIVECKRYNYSNLVGRPELQKFYAACIEEKAEIGFFITTSDFSSSAKIYPNDIENKIQLINGISLIKLMEMAYKSNYKNDQYDVVCKECGDIVKFEFDGEVESFCSSNHLVKSNINEIKQGIFQTANYVFLDPKCPSCGSIMKKRTSKNKKYKPFWGCSKYPSCKGTVRVGDVAPSSLIDLI